MFVFYDTILYLAALFAVHASEELSGTLVKGNKLAVNLFPFIRTQKKRKNFQNLRLQFHYIQVFRQKKVFVNLRMKNGIFQKDLKHKIFLS